MGVKKSSKFPVSVKRGNVVVKVYKVKRSTAKSGFVYSVVWYNGKGLREQRQYGRLQDALDVAGDKAEYLSSAKRASKHVQRSKLEELIQAQDLTDGVPVLSAIKEWKRAKELADGNLIPAAEAWRDQNKQTIELFEVDEVIRRFLKSKKRAGFDINASYARTFPRFQEMFGKKIITTITSRRLQDWLDRTYDHPVTRNTHRKRIVTLWGWSRSQGYLPRNAQTEAELTHRAREEAPEIGIINSHTYLKLLGLIKDNHPDYLGALVLAGFCGMRRSEAHGQLWKDIDFERKFVRVSIAKRGTPAKRLITLCDEAIEWLMLVPKMSEKVCSGSTLFIDRIRKIGINAGLTLPSNCFRHSYISCRVAATGEIDRTALEGGTSARMLHKHYRELVTKEEGLAWFSLRPSVGGREGFLESK